MILVRSYKLHYRKKLRQYEGDPSPGDGYGDPGIDGGGQQGGPGVAGAGGPGVGCGQPVAGVQPPQAQVTFVWFNHFQHKFFDLSLDQNYGKCLI